MDTNAYAVRLTSWVNLIREANTSGLPKKVWCKEHDISTRKFYYWQQKVRSYLMENADLCPTSLSNSKAEMSIHSITPDSSCDRDRFFEISEPSALFDETCQDPTQEQGLGNVRASTMMIRHGSYQVYLGNDVSPSALAAVLKAVRNA